MRKMYYSYQSLYRKFNKISENWKNQRLVRKQKLKIEILITQKFEN